MSGSGGLPIRVAYITGYGRSGSTALDIVLGGHPTVLGVGELVNLSRRAWADNEYCSCHARVRDCRFWSTVVERFTGRLGSNALAVYARLQARFEGSGAIGRDAVGRLTTSAGFADYAVCTRELFTSLADVSGKRMIVDLSKMPGRAVSLMGVGGLDVRLLHLVRDGRGVAWSLGKAYARDERAGIERPLSARAVPRTAVRWAVVNLGAEWVARRAGTKRAIRLRYEDFCSAPDRELQRTSALLDVNLDQLIDRLRAGEPFSPGHLVAGSRLRMAGPVKLRLDSQWRQQMPSRQQRIFQLLSGWLQRRYGYTRPPPLLDEEGGWNGQLDRCLEAESLPATAAQWPT